MGYAWSSFREHEIFLNLSVGLDEDEIQIDWKQNISCFITNEILPDIHSIKDTSQAIYNKGDVERTLEIEEDDTNMKTKLSLKRFGGTLEL